MSQCTFANNTAKGGNTATDASYGGAIEDNPGVNLAVLDCLFTGNQANGGGGPAAYGGAIDRIHPVTVTITDSQFISNTAIVSGMGGVAAGGAVDNFQTMTVDNSVFTGNSVVGGPMAAGVDYRRSGRGRCYFHGQCGFEWRSDQPDHIQ